MWSRSGHEHGPASVASGPREAAHLGAVLIALGGLLAGCGDTGGSSQRQDLHGTALTVVDDEVWVHGGITGPEGIAPPDTGGVPPGWEPNTDVRVYAPNGEIVRRVTLELGVGQVLIGGQVLVHRGAHYLLGTANEPVLFHLAGSKGKRVPLRLPPSEVVDGRASFSELAPLGQADGTAWTLQWGPQLGMGPAYLGFAFQYRLLAIDLETGVGVEVELPAGVTGTDLACLDNGMLYAAQAKLDPDGNVSGVQILRRPAAADGQDWQPLGEVEVAQRPGTLFFGAMLQCVGALDEIIFTLNRYPPAGEVTTMSMTTGTETATRAVLPGTGEKIIGVIDTTALTTARSPSDQYTLWGHRPGHSWQRLSDLDLGGRAGPGARGLVVLDGRLFDARHVLVSAGPEARELREVAI